MTRDCETHNTTFTVIAGLTRNLPNGKDSSPCLRDGGCSSAMTVKGFRVVFLWSHVLQ